MTHAPVEGGRNRPPYETATAYETATPYETVTAFETATPYETVTPDPIGGP